MTEQEKREKTIDEMERDVEEALIVPIYGNNGGICGYRINTSVPVVAARLISNGYRKADEVRKETAKEILQQLYDHCFELVDPYDNECEESFGSVDPEYILYIAEGFGVEVEE